MKKIALIIGINDYQTLPKLRYARQDAEATCVALKQNYSFSDSEIILLTDNRPGLFKPTTRHVIQSHLDNLTNRDLDLFIFSFSGHGFLSNGERYLCPQDMLSNVDSSAYPYSELQKSIAKIRAKNTLMFFDCCQAGDTRGPHEVFTEADQEIFVNFARGISEQRKALPEPSNVVVLNSCKKGECSLESPKYKHGLFTVHLLGAMNCKFDRASKLVSYISDNVTKSAMEMGCIQTPLYILEGDIHLPVGSASTPLVTGDVFISYRHCNADLVAPIEEELQRRGISYFIDRVGINYGMEYPEAISKAINACKTMLFIWTPEADDSSDMLREATMALDYGKTVVPYRIGGFDIKEHGALHYILGPISRYEVSQQTQNSIVEIVNRIQQSLSGVQPQPNEVHHSQSTVPPQNNQSPIERYRLLAEQGDAIAQFNLGLCYDKGNEVSQNFTEAFKWFYKAATQGIAEAQFKLGYYYSIGRGVTADKNLSFEWFRKAAQQGEKFAQYNLGVCYFNGSGVSQNYTEAVRWFNKSAEQGYSLAQYKLASCYESGNGVPQNYAEAIKWYRKAADQGYQKAIDKWQQLSNSGNQSSNVNQNDFNSNLQSAKQGNAAAQYYVGWCYYYGECIAQNYAEAVKWFQKSAEQGNQKAQYSLGVCYENGYGVAQNLTEAVKWYRLSAEQGYANAQYELGLCYGRGKGVIKNDTESVKWLRKAAEQGNADAQVCLGCCYHFGQGVPENRTEAIKWYLKSAEQGNVDAQNNLGSCYTDAQNIPEAIKWYRKAAEQGYVFAQYNLAYRYEAVQNISEAIKWYRKAADQCFAEAKKRLNELENQHSRSTSNASNNVVDNSFNQSYNMWGSGYNIVTNNSNVTLPPNQTGQVLGNNNNIKGDNRGNIMGNNNELYGSNFGTIHGNNNDIHGDNRGQIIGNNNSVKGKNYGTMTGNNNTSRG